MKLHELAAPVATQQISQVFESYFGSRISFDQLTRHQASHMLNRVRGVLSEHRHTPARHTSEQNPDYLKLVMMEQALSARVKEAADTVSGGVAMTKPIQTAADKAKMQQQTTQQIRQVQDPKLKSALDKSSRGQNLAPDEQKLVAGAALQANESRLRRAYKMLKESEVQQAQVVLAAQDMVDKMQGMLEDISELQFKELPALVDSIKNQVGIDQATQFNGDASAALSGLMQNLQAAKQQLDQALGVVTGTAAPAAPDAAAPLPGTEPDAEAGSEIDTELDDLDTIGAEVGADTEPAGAVLGRARRQ